MADIEEDVDRLYQLPLSEFIAARNALAKERKQPDLKSLEKPNAAAWAVNQLFWRERAAYDRLIEAAQALRAEHRKLLGGQAADVAEAERAHRTAVREALDVIRRLLSESDQTASPATMAAVQETLEALPSGDRPGRLTRPLKPLGFEALADIPVKPQLRVVSRRDALAAKPDRNSPASATSRDAERAREAREAREAARQRALEERERKRRQREAEKALAAAEAEMLRAEEAVRKAEKTLAELRAARDEAVRAYERARLRARHES